MSEISFTGNDPVSSACLAVLQLSNIKGLGLKSFHLLYDYFSSAEKVLQASYEELLQAGIKPKLAKQLADSGRTTKKLSNPYLERLFEWVSIDNNYVLCIEDDLYPSSLTEI